MSIVPENSGRQPRFVLTWLTPGELNAAGLTLEARGLYSYLASFPQVPAVSGIFLASPDDRDTTDRALAELVGAGMVRWAGGDR